MDIHRSLAAALQRWPLVRQLTGPDTLVGLCTERSMDMLVGLLGILKAGGAYLPLDPEYPRERLEYMLRDSGAPVLVLQGAMEWPPDKGLAAIATE